MTTATYIVDSSGDDGYIKGTTMNITSQYLIVGIDGTQDSHRCSIWTRFVTTIPQGSVINNATMKYYFKASDGVTVKARFEAVDADNPGKPTTSTDLSVRTTANVTISNVPSSGDYTSPDIKTIIQELVDRTGFGGTMITMLSDNNTSTDNTKRYYQSWDDAGTNPPELYVDYTPPTTFIPHCLNVI